MQSNIQPARVLEMTNETRAVANMARLTNDRDPLCFQADKWEGVATDVFWHALKSEIAIEGPEIDKENAALYSLLTSDRCNSPDRLKAFSEDEIRWMAKRHRMGRPVRVWRAASRGHMTGFRFHTSRARALFDATAIPEPHLIEGLVPVNKILLRIDHLGQKVVIAFPQHVRVREIFVLERDQPPREIPGEQKNHAGIADAA